MEEIGEQLKSETNELYRLGEALEKGDIQASKKLKAFFEKYVNEAKELSKNARNKDELNRYKEMISGLEQEIKLINIRLGERSTPKSEYTRRNTEHSRRDTEHPRRNTMTLEEGPTKYTIGNDERTLWNPDSLNYFDRDVEDIRIEQNGECIKFGSVPQKGHESTGLKLNWSGTYRNGRLEATTTYFYTTGNKEIGIYTSKNILRLEGELNEDDCCIKGTLYETTTATPGDDISVTEEPFTFEAIRLK